jgi:NADP-dependent 3-hydroxy acid dehydrogenase YdfG
MATLRGKSVVITGAASGIGRALALQCAQLGNRLLLADIQANALDSIVAECRALGASCESQITDTGNEAAIFSLADKAQALWGGADVIVNNAGVALVAPVDKLTAADAQWLMNINFWGVVHGCRAFLPQLRAQPEAVIVNISSIFAMVSMPTQSIYNASKAAVRAFSDGLRQELRDTKVLLLCVHPGGISTQIANQARVVDTSLIASSAEEMRAQFDFAARTTPAQAATQIIRAIERGQTRLLIGADAVIFDWLYRLFPSRASGWLTSLLQWERKRRSKG